MTLSVWRYGHLALALCSFLFLALASVTGIILAADAIDERTSPYRADDFGEISLAQTVVVLRAEYSEINELAVDHNHFVTLQGVDSAGEDVHVYVDPRTGNILGRPQKKREFIQWVTAFHRSLFLHEAGRFFVGLIAFLLTLITVSGTVLIIQRQQGIRRFFAGIVNENFAQYAHVVSGRLSLVPIFIIALSGTYLSLARFNLLPKPVAPLPVTTDAIDEVPERKNVADFPVFINIPLTDVQKIEFPFSDDPEDYYTLKLKDREMLVDQFSGNIISESRYPITTVLERVSLDLHTGRTNIVWALVLGIASVNIMFFIYSGFAMTLRRRETTIKNKYKPSESEFILLVGSENGSTLRFANAIHQQLLAHRQLSYLTEMNQYTMFPTARHLVVFTSTHGVGSAPANADKFTSLVKTYPQKQRVNTTVVGFGSHAYEEFCGYAREADEVLAGQSWTKQLLPLHTVNDKSPEQFTQWASAWKEKTDLPLATVPALYQQKPGRLQKMTLIKKTNSSEGDPTLLISFRVPVMTAVTSGDLLAIDPAHDGRERLYSIGKIGNTLQLAVKLHADGLGSGYLNSLDTGSVIRARIVRNVTFHFPTAAPVVVMICNGTGIAPFLGMIEQNRKKSEVYLYGGFRKETTVVQQYRNDLMLHMEKQQLKNFRFAFSREGNSQYVMDLISEDRSFFINLLETGGSIMICGSLAMQHDVEVSLDNFLRERVGKGIGHYRSQGQLQLDCY